MTQPTDRIAYIDRAWEIVGLQFWNVRVTIYDGDDPRIEIRPVDPTLRRPEPIELDDELPPANNYGAT